MNIILIVHCHKDLGIFIFKIFLLLCPTLIQMTHCIFHLIYVITRDDLPTKFLSLSDILLASL